MTKGFQHLLDLEISNVHYVIVGRYTIKMLIDNLN